MAQSREEAPMLIKELFADYNADQMDAVFGISSERGNELVREMDKAAHNYNLKHGLEPDAFPLDIDKIRAIYNTLCRVTNNIYQLIGEVEVRNEQEVAFAFIIATNKFKQKKDSEPALLSEAIYYYHKWDEQGDKKAFEKVQQLIQEMNGLKDRVNEKEAK